MKIGLVGAFKRKSQFDAMCMTKAVMWMVQHGHRMENPEHDVVNLRYGRDFLLELRQYDMVVVFSVFNLKDPTMFPYLPKGLAGQVSPLHTEDRWSKRLVGTGAKFIFVFEGLPASMNGWGLGDLPGYAIRHRDWEYTVYESTA